MCDFSVVLSFWSVGHSTRNLLEESMSVVKEKDQFEYRGKWFVTTVFGRSRFWWKQQNRLYFNRMICHKLNVVFWDSKRRSQPQSYGERWNWRLRETKIEIFSWNFRTIKNMVRWINWKIFRAMVCQLLITLDWDLAANSPSGSCGEAIIVKNEFFSKRMALFFVLFALPVHKGSNEKNKVKDVSEEVVLYKLKSFHWALIDRIELCFSAEKWKMRCSIKQVQL